MVNLAYIEDMAQEEMRKKRQRRQMLARQNASRSQRAPNIKEVITETDDDKPNKKVTTIDYSTILDEPSPVQEEENGGWLSYIKDPFKRFPATQLSTDFPERSLVGYKDAAIRDQMEHDRLAEFEADERFSPVEGVQGPGDLYPETPESWFRDRARPNLPARYRDMEKSGTDEFVSETWKKFIGASPDHDPDAIAKEKADLDKFQSGQADYERGDIVEEVTGLLSIVDTELEGLTKGTGKLSHQPFVDKVEVDTTINKPDFDPRVYDHYGEDIDGKEQRYLAALGDIYKKVAILNAVAALTNSPSQAGAFMQMASKKFETLEGFRTEKRMQKIGKGVFFTEDGTFDPPKTKQEAHERAVAFGASPDEAAAISGDIEEQATTTGSYTTWYNKDTGEERTFQPGVAPVDEKGNVIPGWVKGSKPQHTDRERLYSEVDRLAQTGTPEDARQAYLQLKRYFSTSRDPVTQQLLATMGTASKAAASHLMDTYEAYNLPMPPGLQFDKNSGEIISSAEGGERSEELIGKITVD